jgi:hypothetical protein
VLSKEYGEVCSNFRTLTDIRFKLLAFLPITAAATVAALRGNASEQRPAGTMLALSLFGLVVTIALATYNAQNDQLYDGLVARAAEIERSVGIPDGLLLLQHDVGDVENPRRHAPGRRGWSPKRAFAKTSTHLGV